MSDGVILLHGIFRTHRSMAGLARFLEKQGYRVLNIGYPSTRMTLEQIAVYIHPRIEAFAGEVDGKIHMIGYSMGGLVLRTYLHRYGLPRLGRVVMLATPNNGSAVADHMRGWWLYRTLYGPAGQQLVTDAASPPFPPRAEYELGVIAGNTSYDPFCGRLLAGEHDGKVTVASTKLDGMKEHIVVPVCHTLFPHTRQVWELSLRFLRDGKFISAPE